MKGSSDRTKVVLRHLPPTISQSAFIEQVDSRFAGRYNWFSFRPGKSSQKRQIYSRAYIDFKKPEDVVEFAEFFNGHVFVNEKGTQFKVMVEYAPSQRVPKQWSKKDGREGTILKDPEYLEFLEFLAKPVENLPSAEIQLERKEAERAGAAKDSPIVTPLMDYVRQKRAAKSGVRRSAPNGKPSRRLSATSSGTPSSGGSKRGSEKRRASMTMYVQRDSSKGGSKDKLSYVVVPKRDNQPVSEKSALTTDSMEGESGVPVSTETGKKKILLLKGKEKEIPNVVDNQTMQQTTGSPVKNPVGSTPPRLAQRREPSGRIIRSILQNKDARQTISTTVSPADQQVMMSSSHDKDRRPPRPQSLQIFRRDANGTAEEKVGGTDMHGVHVERQEKRTRNRDRPDRGVWTPLRRSDSSHASDESLSSLSSQNNQLDAVEGSQGETKHDITSVRAADLRSVSRGTQSSVDNGSYKHGRRGSAHGAKEEPSSFVEGKPLKRGGPSGYGPQEKQVWVQKSSSGS